MLFLGDDAGDIAAFEQVRAMRASGRTAWSIGVLASGVAGIAEATDVTLADPAAVVGLLQALAR